jgi:hypothetical protein
MFLLEYQFVSTLLHLHTILGTIPLATYFSVKRTRQELFDFVVVQQEHYYLEVIQWRNSILNKSTVHLNRNSVFMIDIAILVVEFQV